MDRLRCRGEFARREDVEPAEDGEDRDHAGGRGDSSGGACHWLTTVPARVQPVCAVDVLPNVMRLALLAACVLALLAAAAASAADPPRVLFVGNSLTSKNDLPRMVADLASRAGAPIEYEVRAPGGVALEDHWNQTDIREVIANGRWDFVVMQQGPSSLPESAENLRMWAGTFAVRFARRAAGRRSRCGGVVSQVRTRRADLVISPGGCDSRSLLLPVGLAWKNVWKTNPRFRSTVPTASIRASPGPTWLPW